MTAVERITGASGSSPGPGRGWAPDIPGATRRGAGRSWTRASLVVAMAVAALLHPASADAAITAYAEPAFTKTAGNNTFWWHWEAVDGSGPAGAADLRWWMCRRTFRTGMLIDGSDGLNGPGSSRCPLMRSGAGPASGDVASVIGTASYVTIDGGIYTQEQSGFHFVLGAAAPDDPDPASNTTRIDRNAAMSGPLVNGGAAYVTSNALSARISYLDALSPPWVGPDGRASVWTSLTAGGPGVPSGATDTGCGAPASLSNDTTIDCTRDVSAVADGRYWFCEVVADSAVPDNPGGPDQFALASSENANLSGPVCDDVVIDRTPPAIAIAPMGLVVQPGKEVILEAVVSDMSGVSKVEWTFSDGSAVAHGLQVTRAFAAPGSYTVHATATDPAGNTAAAQTVVVVAAARPPVIAKTRGAVPLVRMLGAAAIARAAGAPAARTVALAGMRLRMPTAFRAGGGRRIAVTYTTPGPGRLGIALVRGSRTYARVSAVLGWSGRWLTEIHPPLGLGPGTYRLRFTFTSAGASTRGAYPITVRRRSPAKASTRALRHQLLGVPYGGPATPGLRITPAR